MNLKNDSNIFITVRIANLKESDVRVTIINDALDVITQLQNNRQFRMHFNLFKTVVVDDSNWGVDSAKLCITLKKTERRRWHSLEALQERGKPKPRAYMSVVTLKNARQELDALIAGDVNALAAVNNPNDPITITHARNSPDQGSPPISLDYVWFQSDETISLMITVPTIFMPDSRMFLLYEDDLSIMLTDSTLNWVCCLPTGVVNVNFKLYRKIDPNDSRFEISSCRSRIEIQLRKAEPHFWPHFVIFNGQQPGEGFVPEGMVIDSNSMGGPNEDGELDMNAGVMVAAPGGIVAGALAEGEVGNGGDQQAQLNVNTVSMLENGTSVPANREESA